MGEVSCFQDMSLDPDPWKTFWIRIRHNDADPLDPEPQHCPQDPFSTQTQSKELFKAKIP